MTIVAQVFRPAVHAQTPAPLNRVTFQQAIDRAMSNNPSAAVAAAGILRAEGLLRQARAATMLQVDGNVRRLVEHGSVVRGHGGVAAAPDHRVVDAGPADHRGRRLGAARAGAGQPAIAQLSAADTRRQIALATADAYFTILTRRRVLDGDSRAAETARAHFDLATQLEQQGTGSRLNALRAQQQLSSFERQIEFASLSVYLAQEALGVLMVANGPVDATDEPSFDLPPDAAAIASSNADLGPVLLQFRTDLRLFSSERQAAARVLSDSSKDRWPSLNAIFVPQSVYPGQFFSSQNSWRLLLQAQVPIFDSGTRSAQKVQRQAALDVAQANLTDALSRASSEVRAAREAVASGGRGFARAQAAADQAQQVVNIVNVSFRAGAATNIEVIDAERSARDADTAAAVAEDILRRARLDLLLALGRFP